MLFPEKIYSILSCDHVSDAISWLPDGRSWKILSKKKFEEKVINEFFGGIKYESFMRQVNKWGFKRKSDEPIHNSFHHKYFVRGRPELMRNIQRAYKTKHKKISNRRYAPRRTTYFSTSSTSSSSPTLASNSSSVSMERIEDLEMPPLVQNEEENNKVDQNREQNNYEGLFDDLPKEEQEVEETSNCLNSLKCSQFVQQTVAQAKTSIDEYIKILEESSNIEKLGGIYNELSILLKQQSNLYSMLLTDQNILYNRLLLRLTQSSYLW